MTFESYVHGNCGAPLIGSTIGAFLEGVAATDGADAWSSRINASAGATLNCWPGRTRSQRVSSLGLEPGDRVARAPNCAETGAQFPTGRAGLILVTINPAYRVTEL